MLGPPSPSESALAALFLAGDIWAVLLDAAFPTIDVCLARGGVNGCEFEAFLASHPLAMGLTKWPAI